MNYFAPEQISGHIAKTPEGFIIAADTVLARTGNQEYSVQDLPQEGADKLGVDLSNPRAPVTLFRPPEEVFSADAMASVEGKPLTLNHPPNNEFVGPDNIQDLSYGHVQNIRKGKEALESGDWPLIGDIIITREPLLSQIENGARPELSCGYEYELDRDGDNLLQTAIRINHIAVVPKGRAGAEARIADAAPDPAVREIPSGRQTAGGGSTGETEKKEKRMSLKRIFGLGLKAAALDDATKPEDLAE